VPLRKYLNALVVDSITGYLIAGDPETCADCSCEPCDTSCNDAEPLEEVIESIQCTAIWGGKEYELTTLYPGAFLFHDYVELDSEPPWDEQVGSPLPWVMSITVFLSKNNLFTSGWEVFAATGVGYYTVGNFEDYEHIAYYNLRPGECPSNDSECYPDGDWELLAYPPYQGLLWGPNTFRPIVDDFRRLTLTFTRLHAS
jgi:hypothetical protein